MHQPYYTFYQISTKRYAFISVGRLRIKKVVIFSKMRTKNTFNLGFGDLRSDGSIDDSVSSNNGDIVKVMATVIAIIDDFTLKNRGVNIIFTGSTVERTKLYTRILKSYFLTFSKEFVITAFMWAGDSYKQVLIDPGTIVDYAFFLIKRIN
jgi:hypothetical protein